MTTLMERKAAMNRRMRIDVFKGRGTQPWRWRLVWSNGEIAATSEGYSRKGTAVRLGSKLAAALGARVVVAQPRAA